MHKHQGVKMGREPMDMTKRKRTRMPPFSNKWLLGKRVTGVSSQREKGSGGEVTNLTEIAFSDGSKLLFMVGETNGGEYNVIPIYISGRRRRGA